MNTVWKMLVLTIVVATPVFAGEPECCPEECETKCKQIGPLGWKDKCSCCVPECETEKKTKWIFHVEEKTVCLPHWPNLCSCEPGTAKARKVRILQKKKTTEEHEKVKYHVSEGVPCCEPLPCCTDSCCEKSSY